MNGLRMELTALKSSNPTPATGNPAVDTALSRERIRSEIQEVREREKRKQSVIIRGINIESTNELPSKLSLISNLVLQRDISFSDFFTIDRNKKLYRCKILNDEDRQEFLGKTKMLKQSEDFKLVYFNRDLTYAQRQSLLARRSLRSGAVRDSSSDPLEEVRPLVPSGPQSRPLN